MVDLSLVKLNDFWYIVGLIATDGNLSPNGRHIVITSKDRGFLYSVRRALHLQATLGRKANGYKKEKIYSVLQFSDVNLYKILEKIGLTKRKSLIIGPLKISRAYFIDFLRGVIDGDGNIQTWRHASNGNMQWSVRVVSGSPRFLPWLKEKIATQIGVGGRLHKSAPQEGKNILHTLKYGKFAAKIILRTCYYKNALALNRKLKIAKKCIQSSNGLSCYGSFRAT